VVDRNFLRANGAPATATVHAGADAATGITGFTLSGACVRVSARARMDTGELVDLTVDLCDNSASGGTDAFTVSVPTFNYNVSGALTSGDVVIGSTS
jgi:hypothetical protein